MAVIGKADFVEKLSEKMGSLSPKRSFESKAFAEDCVDSVFETITEIVSEGNDFSIKGFGTFKAVSRSERVARNLQTGEQIIIPAKNPQTGEQIIIPAKKVPVFKPGNKFKSCIK